MEGSSSMIGLLVMAYGGPDKLEDVEPYLMDVRGYRPTSQEIIHEVRERYREIGGRSPILEQTQAQADALESALNVNGGQFKVYIGMRHWQTWWKCLLQLPAQYNWCQLRHVRAILQSKALGAWRRRRSSKRLCA